MKEISLAAGIYTVKLARAKLPANAGNFTCSSQVKRSPTQFTCVTCSLPVKPSKFTCVEAASTSRRIHAKCLQAHVNLPEYHGHLLVILYAELMQNCPRLACKISCICRQKYKSLAGKNTRIASKNTRTIASKKSYNSTQNYLQLQAICYHTAGKFSCKSQVI